MLYDLYSTVELIAQASSNHHILFCFCNAIIICLVFGSSKSGTRELDEYTTTLVKDTDYNKKDSKEEEEVAVVEEDDTFNEVEMSKEDEDQQDEDELRRKVEEFIKKMKGQLSMES